MAGTSFPLRCSCGVCPRDAAVCLPQLFTANSLALASPGNTSCTEPARCTLFLRPSVPFLPIPSPVIDFRSTCLYNIGVHILRWAHWGGSDMWICRLVGIGFDGIPRLSGTIFQGLIAYAVWA
ncbi:hypothetical protein M430DRAFT_260308 [Amorphotheca resinae ATCC 22711]|uniref:Uncharacterized protein n=1 Tax=Amorphotheca resinae ATCC 22711 TaxID=857342 RepID=A0A2T3AZ73_AMORE|nr:hypothetical protein M430DRAFT_260308 [Amorphotheca resinae ATCC 22711]PSS15364.1 hypothetical protein M430DRAFT_260308 [Amorphotheca resinae ATCC 22711]